jgi:RNA polymerase sigma factor (sigma-70 family)
MQEIADMELVRQYAQRNSDEAFATLVTRHVNLVYSAALRKTGNADAAGEITQAVFIILAKKAGRLGQKTILSGWLYQTTRLTAANFLRTEIRRAHREQEAYMQSLANETEPELWPQMAPLLEDAMGRLGEKDRNAIALRFFEGKSFEEIGAAFGASENAAKKRVAHALEKLHRYFSKRGVSSTPAIIAGAISVNSVQAAPAVLAKAVTAVAITKGTAASASTLTLIKGALKIMAWMKMKTAAVVGIAALLAAGTTTVVVKEIGWPSIRDDDPVWEMTPEGLAKAPSVVLVRPTHFHDQQGKAASDNGGITGGRYMGIQPMIAYAYSWPFTRMVLPLNAPRGLFDYLITIRDHPKERFQDEIRKQLGLIGRREIRETEVLLLRVKRPGATGITVSDGTPLWAAGNPSRSWLDIHNKPISTLAGNLESYFAKPILDQTGLTDRYDTDLKWIQKGSYQTDSKTLQNALLDQLGLELVPSREPVEMLVVEKAS